MITPFENQRYYALWNYNKKTFGCRVMKAVLDCNFTCPNIDGTKGTGGCIFCSNGSGYFIPKGTISQQLEQEKTRIYNKFPDAKIIAYLQSNTNTYAPLSKLRKIYEEILSYPDIMGITIGTRPDCLSDDIISYLSELSKKTNLTIELGLQTTHDKTAEKINRCYLFSDFLNTYTKLKKHNIRTCIHIINGLPDENADDMIKTASVLGQLQPDAIKIHLLHIIKGTRLADLFQSGNIDTMTKEEYVNLVVKQLELFSPQTVIERLTGDGDAKNLIAPLWSKNKKSVLNDIAKQQKLQDSYQGIKFKIKKPE